MSDTKASVDRQRGTRFDWVRSLVPAGMARSGWSGWHVLGLLLLVEAGFVVTADAWSDIFRIAARDEEASHIFLVPLVASWLSLTLLLSRYVPTQVFKAVNAGAVLPLATRIVVNASNWSSLLFFPLWPIVLGVGAVGECSSRC